MSGEVTPRKRRVLRRYSKVYEAEPSHKQCGKCGLTKAVIFFDVFGETCKGCKYERQKELNRERYEMSATKQGESK